MTVARWIATSAGLLAPLGWLAVAAVDPERAADCLADPELPRDPLGTQRRHWGLDQGGIARQPEQAGADRIINAVGAAESQTVALTSAAARYFLRQIVESSLPNLAVLSHNEIPPGVRMVSLGAI